MKEKQSKLIEKNAVDLLEKFNFFNAPVDVENLVLKLGIELSYEDLEDDVSGFLLTKGGKKAIVINSNHHENRRRFSIAHEIGHSLLHDKKRELYLDSKKTTFFFRDQKSSSGVSRIEIEANEFAAQLLMPKKLIETLVNKFLLDLTDENDVSNLAKKLRVSEQALTFRLSKLGAIG